MNLRTDTIDFDVPVVDEDRCEEEQDGEGA